MPVSDEELMTRVRDGDQEAFNSLYLRYEPRLRSLIASFQCSPEDVRDCVQDTFLRLWLSRSGYRPTAPFAAYLFTIARTCWIDRVRRLRCRPVETPTDDADDPLAAEQEHVEWAPEASLMLEYRRWRVRKAVESIPRHYRETLELIHLNGMKYTEAAERLGVPIGTVKSRIAAAVKMLRERLQEETL